MPLTTRTKAVLAAALSVTVTGLWLAASFLKRRKRRNQPRRIVRPLTNAFANGGVATGQRRSYTPNQTSSPKHGHRPRVTPVRPLSTVSSARASIASSVGSLSSISTLQTDGTCTPTNNSASVTVDGMFQLGIDAFEKALHYWQTALHVKSQSQTEIDAAEDMASGNFISQLEKLVNSATELRHEIEDTAVRLSASNLADVSLDVSSTSRERSISFGPEVIGDDNSSSDSFVSAAELEELAEMSASLDFFPREYTGTQELYDKALRVAREGGVQCRRLRTEVLECTSDEDFLAKVHCLRQAMACLFQDETTKDYFANMGLQLTSDLLYRANYDTDGFYKAYDEMIAYVKDHSNWKDIEKELYGRKVKFISFYDVVLDFYLLDAFDDLANPPASILTVIQNRWLSNGVKETALATAVWSVLAAKTRMLQNPNGFLAKMYRISHHMTPALAWGFMGTNEELKELMMYFKDQVMQFCRDIFSLDRCRYSSIPELSDDIYTLAQQYEHTISTKLNS